MSSIVKSLASLIYLERLERIFVVVPSKLYKERTGSDGGSVRAAANYSHRHAVDQPDRRISEIHFTEFSLHQTEFEEK